MPRHFRRTARAALAALGAGVAMSPAAADGIALVKRSCTTLNCGTTLLGGRINGHPASPALANAWVGQFNGASSGCLRFQVVSESRNLAMTVVAPNGTVYTNDNGGVAACTACPLVTVGATSNGFYTVVIANRDGFGGESSFSLRAGLYDSDNSPNCSDPTPGK